MPLFKNQIVKNIWEGDKLPIFHKFNISFLPLSDIKVPLFWIHSKSFFNRTQLTADTCTPLH